MKALAFQIVKTAGLRIAKTTVRYVRDDETRTYALLEPTAVILGGSGIGVVCGKRIAFKNNTFEIASYDNGDALMMAAKPFPASTRYWNGPNIIADINDGRMEASLYHDLLWQFRDAICEANGLDDEWEYLKWTNTIFAVLWQGYAKRKGGRGWFARTKSGIAAWWLNSRISKWFARAPIMFFALLISGCSGCYTPPDGWQMDDGDEVEWARGDDGN